MAKYAVKTCNNCGIRKPQPEMERVEKMTVSGSSKTKLTTGNVLGAIAGSKTSERAVKRAILGNNKRQYQRKTTVWNCKECSGTNDRIRSQQARANKEIKAAEEKAKEKQDKAVKRQQEIAAAARAKADEKVRKAKQKVIDDKQSEINLAAYELNKKEKKAKAERVEKARQKKIEDKSRNDMMKKSVQDNLVGPKERLRTRMLKKTGLRQVSKWLKEPAFSSSKKNALKTSAASKVQIAKRDAEFNAKNVKYHANKNTTKKPPAAKASAYASRVQQAAAKNAAKNKSKKKPSVSKPDTYASRVQQAAEKNKSKQNMQSFAAHVRAAAAKNKKK